MLMIITYVKHMCTRVYRTVYIILPLVKFTLFWSFKKIFLESFEGH